MSVPPMSAPTPTILRSASSRRIRSAATVVAVAGLGLVLWLAADLVALVALGAMLAYLLMPVADRLERMGMGRTAAAALVLVVLATVLTVGVALAAPTVAEQAASMRARWQSGELLALVARAEALLAARLPVQREQVGLVEALQATVRSDGGPLVGYVPSVIEGAVNAILVPFVLFALLRDGPVLRRRVLSLVPNGAFEFAMNVLFKADAALGGYLRGQALVALAVGATTALGLGLLGVDSYLVLGLVTGLLNFVPYVGFFVSAALAVTVSILATGDLRQPGFVVLLFGGLQLIENIVFQPWITGRNVEMHPVLVLLSILIGERLGGVVGMAFAVPVAAVLKVAAVETTLGLRRYRL